jgi:hypothetical protein
MDWCVYALQIAVEATSLGTVGTLGLVALIGSVLLIATKGAE